VVTRYTMQGTYQGEMQGMAPTGKQVTATGIVIDRYADGKIAVTNCH
jgi:predicted ester cyclase